MKNSFYKKFCSKISCHINRAQEEHELPSWCRGKESTSQAGDAGSIPGLRIFPGERNGYLLQYSAREIPCVEEPGELQSMGSQGVEHNLAKTDSGS